jgi:hypothetical protein
MEFVSCGVKGGTMTLTEAGACLRKLSWKMPIADDDEGN